MTKRSFTVFSNASPALTARRTGHLSLVADSGNTRRISAPIAHSTTAAPSKTPVLGDAWADRHNPNN